MIVLAAAFATLTTLAVAACTNPQPTALSQMPSPVPQPTPPPAPPPTLPPTQISVWQNVEGTLTTAHPADAYELTSPNDGTLMVRIEWDVWTNGTLLSVRIDGTEFRPRPRRDLGLGLDSERPLPAGHRHAVEAGVLPFLPGSPLRRGLALARSGDWGLGVQARSFA
jgi:hypothetical protein